MKTIIKTYLLIVAVVLGCFGLLSGAQAVLPPPDGGYPGGNTAEGTKALFSLTTGGFNTAAGWYSLFTDSTGSYNTGLGAGTLVLNTGNENTAIGTAALLLNTASGNTAIGSRALLNNTTGGTLGNIQGVDIGPNVAAGQQALESNTVASANTAVGYQALHSFTTGPTGLEQIGLCTAVGFQALANATGPGVSNNAFGYQALSNNTDGAGNVAIGLQALFSNTTGGGNVANGNDALSGNTGGSYNIALGFNAGGTVTTADNVICIGAAGANVSDSCYIGNIWTRPGGSQAVYVNAEGKLGALVSSRRFKEEIKPMSEASEALFSLNPVSFRYKKEIDPARTSQFGLVAEDVEKVNPDLIVRDKEEKPYSVRYDQVNAMLLNEFLKEHKRVQELQATVVRQQEAMDALVAHIKEQDAKIQKVSDQLKTDNPAPQVAAIK